MAGTNVSSTVSAASAPMFPGRTVANDVQLIHWTCVRNGKQPAVGRKQAGIEQSATRIEAGGPAPGQRSRCARILTDCHRWHLTPIPPDGHEKV